MACRLCLRIFENDSEYSQMAQHQDEEFLVNFLFEVLDMEITSDPLICTGCRLFTEKIHRFLEECLTAQNRLYDYIRERGLLTLSNDDLVSIARQRGADGHVHHQQQAHVAKDTQAGYADADEYITIAAAARDDCDDDEITTTIDSAAEVMKASEDPNLFQYVITVAEDGTVCNEVTVSQTDGGHMILSKTADDEHDMPAAVELMQYHPDGDVRVTTEGGAGHADGHILGPKLGYPDAEGILTDIIVYNEEEEEEVEGAGGDKVLDFSRSVQTLLRANPTIGALETEDYGKIDPKMFECPAADMGVLDFQPKEGIYDVEHGGAEMFNEILNYDERMSAEMLVYQDDMEKISTAEEEEEEEEEEAQQQPTAAADQPQAQAAQKGASFESCVCDQCGLPFKNKRGLISHVIQKHKAEGARKCSLCGYETNYKSHMERHMKFQHNDAVVNAPPPKLHKCPNCPYKTPRKDTLHYHVKYVHGEKEQLETLRCHLCDYHTVRKKNLTSHVRYKHSRAGELEQLNCPYCPYQTVRKKYLQYHMKYQHSRHGKTKTHQCPNCDFKTYKEDSLAQHLEQEHPNGDNPKFHKCTICGYQTVRKASLKLHVKCRHRREEECETLRCEHCPFQTHRRDAYRKHVRFVHALAGDLPVHRCYHCRYQTVRKLDFHRHMRSKHKDEEDL